MPHERYMRRCIELAEQALATGDAPVGSLIVLNGGVIAEGVESVKARRDVTAHAEIEALRAACARIGSRDLTGSTLYTTVEPCPMCAYAIRLARVGAVVSGTSPPSRESVERARELLLNPAILPDRPPPSIVRGVLEAECAALLNRPRPKH